MFWPPDEVNITPAPPQFALLTSRNRLFRNTMSLVMIDVFVATPSTSATDATCRTILLVNFTCWTTAHGAPPSWFTGVIMNAYPCCAAAQQYSIRLLSTVMRCAFFISNRFLMVQP